MQRGRIIITVVTCLSLSLAPAEMWGQSSDVHLRGPCEANLLGALGALGGGESEHIYTEGTVFSNVPPQLVRFATTPHDGYPNGTVMAIPLNNAQFKSVFKTDFVSAGDAAQVAEAQSFASRDRLVASSAIQGRSDFRRYLKDERGKFLLIAGHNENGEFVFLGGNKVSLPLLGEDCARAVKVCIFISCKSNDHLKDGAIGVSRNLTLAEGVYVTTKIRRWLVDHPEVSIVQVAAFTRSVELRAYFRYHVSYFAMAACAAAGTPAVAYLLIEGVQQRQIQEQ